MTFSVHHTPAGTYFKMEGELPPSIVVEPVPLPATEGGPETAAENAENGDTFMVRLVAAAEPPASS